MEALWDVVKGYERAAKEQARARRRWEAMEASCNGRGERIEDVGAERLEELWQQAKRTVG